MGKNRHQEEEAVVDAPTYEEPTSAETVPAAARQPRAKLTKREAVMAIFRVLDRLEPGVAATDVMASVEALR
jgi:hypothetical protein